MLWSARIAFLVTLNSILLVEEKQGSKHKYNNQSSAI